MYKKTVPLEFRFFDYMVTAIYILDLIVHLSTGDNVEEGSKYVLFGNVIFFFFNQTFKYVTFTR